MTTYTSADFKRWGAKGPKARKRHRKLTTKQAKAMVKAREDKKQQARLAKHRTNP